MKTYSKLDIYLWVSAILFGILTVCINIAKMQLGGDYKLPPLIAILCHIILINTLIAICVAIYHKF